VLPVSSIYAYIFYLKIKARTCIWRITTYLILISLLSFTRATTTSSLYVRMSASNEIVLIQFWVHLQKSSYHLGPDQCYYGEYIDYPSKEYHGLVKLYMKYLKS
jgi:hypothetical protein